ncbi:MAG: histidine phosphatase family protein [Lachnospiraceae bacterium]|nr:histidine phosphatase family protein [Lachnospiraceae bacterium]
MKLYIIRHGETLWNKEKRLQGRTDIELSDEGKRIASLSSEGMRNIPFSHIFSSPLKRALLTAEIIRADRPVDIVKDNRLLEVCFGKYEGQVISKTDDSNIANFFKAPELYHPEGGGESYKDIYARCTSFVDEVLIPLSKKEPHAEVLISGHGAINKGIIAVLMNKPVKEYWSGIFMDNCAVNIFEFSDKNVSHLEECKYFY